MARQPSRQAAEEVVVEVLWVLVLVAAASLEREYIREVATERPWKKRAILHADDEAPVAGGHLRCSKYSGKVRRRHSSPQLAVAPLVAAATATLAGEGGRPPRVELESIGGMSCTLGDCDMSC